MFYPQKYTMDESKNESRDTRAKMRTENLFLSLKNSIFSKKNR